MEVVIFFSWQSDIPAKYCKGFIHKALEKSVAKLQKRPEYSNIKIKIEIDSRGVPGSPPILGTINERISTCQIFIADVTFINGGGKRKKRLYPNPNVIFELGSAMQRLGNERVIFVMNEAYGEASADALPFDIVSHRWPIRYTYSKSIEEKKSEILDEFEKELTRRLNEAISHGIKEPRWPNAPFLDMERWQRMLAPTIEFIKNSTIETKLNTIKSLSSQPGCKLRIVGLSGLGKTRLVFEALITLAPKDRHKVLYLDLATSADGHYQTLSRLSESDEHYIIVLDNCSSREHENAAMLVSKTGSRLGLITIDYNPINSFERSNFENLIDLFQAEYAPIIDEILLKYFPDPEQEKEREQIKQFANGHTLIATTLASNRVKLSDGQNWTPLITNKDILDKLLGVSTDSVERGILTSVSIFRKIGFYEELASESEFIAKSSKIQKKHIPDHDVAIVKFKEVCEEFRDREILEKQGRYLRVRTIPIGLSLAVDWWKKCDPQYAREILNSLSSISSLQEALVEQLRLLDFLPNAREIVKDFVSERGPFGQAEVLITKTGSRLFRSFVEVNPAACTDALERAFGHWTTEELLKVGEGRRNLVWSMEKLCFRKDTFLQAAQMLVKFAIAENEEISNNSLGQLQQLFHVMLPGTEASLNDRRTLLEFILSVPDLEHRKLAVILFQNAFETQRFNRMGGAEKQGSTEILADYHPEGKEIYEYWKFCFESAKLLIRSEESFNVRSDLGQVLLGATRGMLRAGFFDLSLEFIEFVSAEFSELSYATLNTLAALLQFDEEYMSDEERLTIKNKIETLLPSDFCSKYMLFFKHSLYELNQYLQGEEEFGNYFRAQADELAIQFLDEGYYLKDCTNLFFANPQHNGFYFGVALHDESYSRKLFADVFLNMIRFLEADLSDVQDLSVLSGLLLKLPGKEKLEYFKAISENPELGKFTFIVAKAIAPNNDIVNLLIKSVDNGSFNVSSFLLFEYSHVFYDFDLHDTTRLVEWLSSKRGEGIASAIYILNSRLNDSQEHIEKYTQLSVKVLSSDNYLKYQVSKDRLYQWSYLVSKILTKEGQGEFATTVISQIAEYFSNNTDWMADDRVFQVVYEMALSHYFDQTWNVLKEFLATQDYIAYRQIVHSFELLSLNGYSNSLLFKYEKSNEIIDWIIKKGITVAERLVGIVPVTETGNKRKWSSEITRLIDHFGNEEVFLSALGARVGSFSWSGSAVPFHQSLKVRMESLLNHKFPKVRDWASRHIRYLNEEIRRESNYDEEHFIP